MSGDTHRPACIDLGCEKHRGQTHRGKLEDCTVCQLVTCLRKADPDYIPGRSGGRGE